ncbi:MAG TPA: UrcA family protein [Caulobacteraceae bacterium]|nr:UrcA family protein [Caulobacteraceae bacterium]
MPRLMLTAGLATLLLGGVVSQAFAEDHTVIEMAAVKTSDLNLGAEQGARTLLRRVAARANDLCTQTDTPLARGAEKSRRACVAKAVAVSVARINAPRVTAEYTRAYGAPPTVVAAR